MNDSSHTHGREKRIGNLLIELGFITEQQMHDALELAKEKKIRIGEALASMGLLDKDEIYWVLGTQLDMTYVDPSLETTDTALVSQFPIKVLRELQCLPLYESVEEIRFAIADPTDSKIVERVKRLRPGKRVTLHLALPEKIDDILSVFPEEPVTVESAKESAEAVSRAPAPSQITPAESQWSELAATLVSARHGQVFWLYETSHECRLFRQEGKVFEAVNQYASGMTRAVGEQIEKNGIAANASAGASILLAESGGQRAAFKVLRIGCLGRHVTIFEPIRRFSREEFIKSNPAIPRLLAELSRLISQHRRLFIGGKEGLFVKQCCCSAIGGGDVRSDFPPAFFVERNVEMYFPDIAQVGEQALLATSLMRLSQEGIAPFTLCETECSLLACQEHHLVERLSGTSGTLVLYAPFPSLESMRQFLLEHEDWRQKGLKAFFVHNYELKTV